uniref:ULP_PROTEASE domain-containing protein n=1 Tax=Panagrellus redivivus TaxID=6233 RepID=A0A7E4ZZT4_PANRE
MDGDFQGALDILLKVKPITTHQPSSHHNATVHVQRHADMATMSAAVAVIDEMTREHNLTLDEELQVIENLAALNLPLHSVATPSNSVDQESVTTLLKSKVSDVVTLCEVAAEAFGEHLFRERDAGVIERAYQSFASNTKLKLWTVEDVLLTACCERHCGLTISPVEIMNARLIFPVSSCNRGTMYTVVNDILYQLVRPYCCNSNFEPIFKGKSVCYEFFCRIYGIPRCRLDKFVLEASLGLPQSLNHGLTGRKFERKSTIERIAHLANTVSKYAEPQPNGPGFMMPHRMTKSDLVNKEAFPEYKYRLNVTREIRRLQCRLHFERSNDLTKCDTCIKLKYGLLNHVFKDEYVEMAKEFLKQHYKDVVDDRHDYALRREVSRESDEILSLAHDGMSKEQTKFPHQKETRTKKIADGDLLTCTLNCAVVHKKFGSKPDTLCFFWNVHDTSPGGSNATITQLFQSLLASPHIPRVITIQLDNCSINKSYTTLAAFAMLLKWVPEIKQIFICMSEVGHTHIDVDGYFGLLATTWKRIEIPTPQAFQRFVASKFDSVAMNVLFPTTYDFKSYFKGKLAATGELNANHLFELTLNSDGEPVVRVGRYVRSETYLTFKKNKETCFPVFKDVPSATSYPKIMPDRAFDCKRLECICKAARGCMSLEDYNDLVNLPKLFEARKPMEFKDLLQQLRSKAASSPTTTFTAPKNLTVRDFLDNPNIWKTWSPNVSNNLVSTETAPGFDDASDLNDQQPSESIEKERVPTSTAKRPSRSTTTRAASKLKPKATIKRTRGRPPKKPSLKRTIDAGTEEEQN